MPGVTYDPGGTPLPAAERGGPGGRVLGVDLSEDVVALLAARTSPSGNPMVEHAAFVVAEKHAG